MKTKLKLSLLDDYLAICKILISCNNYLPEASELADIKKECENLLNSINSVFESPKKDFSFAIFKQQVFLSMQQATNMQAHLQLQNQILFGEFNTLKQNVVAKINKL